MKKSIVNLFDYRTEIYGFSALLIVFHHLGNRGIPFASSMPFGLNLFIDFVFSKAYVGVDIFVFLSAVGLYYSMDKHSVKTFYYNRFIRFF